MDKIKLKNLIQESIEDTLEEMVIKILEKIIEPPKNKLNESQGQVLPSCITHSLLVAKRVAKRASFPEDFMNSISSAIRIALYNEIISNKDLLTLTKIIEELATADVTINKLEKQTILDALETLGSMHKKIQHDLDSTEGKIDIEEK